ncbi:hypothetical protein CPC08DRAFT_654735 [Agrocybe pediades]|nr:hypothetical protein CPC08DRAFT_654735 [Agrocybe pediades]
MGSPGWGSAAATPGHTNPSAFHQLASSFAQSSFSKPSKRRLEPEDEVENNRNSASRDESMDRSPTPPERPKRAPPKRARIMNQQGTTSSKDGAADKGSKSSSDDDVDVGVLLASLPPQSLLPILSSLIQAEPSLKSTIIPLIPRPTLEVAVQVLAQSAKKLREAYPYSITPTFSQISHGFGSSSTSSQPPTQPAMRDSYVISRLRPHIADYVSACMSYFPYFSCIPPPEQTANNSSTSNNPTSATTIHSLHSAQFHPSETFLFFSAVTNQILQQPPLTLNELAPMIMPRLSQEWKTWVDKIDAVVNQQGGMFGSETVRNWERALDEFADSKAAGVSEEMRRVRDSWVSKVGWLVGRNPQHSMDEL